jgi:endonuclease G, mitochondrial
MQIGYDPDFIGDGVRVPWPTFISSLNKSVLHKAGSLRDEIYSDHIHYSIVMNENTRQLIYSAYNIDQAQFRPKVKGAGKRGWKNDSDVGAQNQLDNKYYKDRKSVTGVKIPNPYDRGHMVMRFNNMWGSTNSEADKAGKATFLYSNSSLQHENLNRDEWKAIEIKIVREFQHSSNGRLAVFTGPIFGDLDRHINITDQDSARVPSGFFKIICFKKKKSKPGEELGVLAFAVFQDDAVLRDKKGNRTVKQNTSYQVTISEIQNWTGIKFGKKLYSHNPLFYHDLEDRNVKHNVSFAPERIPVEGASSIISDSSAMRNRMLHLSERKVIINSAMINPVGNEKLGEWVSLHNRGNRKIKIDNWRLVDGQGRGAVLTGSINSGESIRLKGKNKGKIQLSNNGGSMMLYDKEGCVIDHVTWSKKQVGRILEGLAFMFDNGN